MWPDSEPDARLPRPVSVAEWLWSIVQADAEESGDRTLRELESGHEQRVTREGFCWADASGYEDLTHRRVRSVQTANFCSGTVSACSVVTGASGRVEHSVRSCHQLVVWFNFYNSTCFLTIYIYLFKFNIPTTFIKFWKHKLSTNGSGFPKQTDQLSIEHLHM